MDNPKLAIAATLLATAFAAAAAWVWWMPQSSGEVLIAPARSGAR